MVIVGQMQQLHEHFTTSTRSHHEFNDVSANSKVSTLPRSFLRRLNQAIIKPDDNFRSLVNFMKCAGRIHSHIEICVSGSRPISSGFRAYVVGLAITDDMILRIVA